MGLAKSLEGFVLKLFCSVLMFKLFPHFYLLTGENKLGLLWCTD